MSDRGPTYRFSARLWEHAGQGAWPFVTLPEDCAAMVLRLVDLSR